MTAFSTLRVCALDKTTDNAVVVSFEIPKSLMASYFFTPGQYVSIEAVINGKAVRRSYSLCSSPEEDILKVGVKKIEDGLFSSYINDSLKVGHSLIVSSPEGRFVYDTEKQDGSLLAIAAGSGITPIYSIINAFLSTNKDQYFTLIYGNKSPDQTMFYKELKALETLHSTRFKIHWVFSQYNQEGALFGRINPSVINFALNQQEKVPDHSFLCGPETMIVSAKDQLIRKGLSKESIHFELFTPSSEKKEIDTKVKTGIFKITCDEVTHTLELTPQKTLLEIALDNKIEVPYSCQGGVCSSCIAKVIEGKADMEINQILTDQEVEEGLVLSCQAIAQSESIHLDFDDV
jgi:ring-1,2-phenylacetyl-CoA epoxidase subunit PaaE